MITKIELKLKRFSEVMEKFPLIRYAGDPILRSVASEASVEEGVEIGTKLGEMLVEYRKFAGMGRGLAAPQIGLAKRVFVTYLDDQIQIYINPQMTSTSKQSNHYRELCLSSGLMWGDVVRSTWVVLKWTDAAGREKEEKFEGVVARLIQHELDHLQGVMNLDRAEPGSIEFALADPLKEVLRDSK
ncbi:MAG: peptide deformylase [bacterium]|nr:peptide deformylase [bacterium]